MLVAWFRRRRANIPVEAVNLLKNLRERQQDHRQANTNSIIGDPACNLHQAVHSRAIKSTLESLDFLMLWYRYVLKSLIIKITNKHIIKHSVGYSIREPPIRLLGWWKFTFSISLSLVTKAFASTLFISIITRSRSLPSVPRRNSSRTSMLSLTLIIVSLDKHSSTL